MPNFIGMSFPQNDDAQVYPLYCACVLLLLKLWRDIRYDLKASGETWDDALRQFSHNSPSKIQQITSNLQFFHESADNEKYLQNGVDDDFHDNTSAADVNDDTHDDSEKLPSES